MIKIIIILFAITYIFLIVQNLYKIKKLNKILKTISKLRNSYLNGSRPNVDAKLLNKVLYMIPSINSYLSCFTFTSMRYGLHDSENLRHAGETYEKLKMAHIYLIDKLKRSLSPFHTVKKLFSLPSTFINWIGFQPGNKVKKMINLIAWFVSLIAGLYSDEIKALVSSLFQ